MTIIENEISIGLPSPVKFIHVSDTHLTRVDEQDSDRKQELARSRCGSFPENEKHYAEILKTAEETGLPVCHTGDLIDFVSHANLLAAKEFSEKADCFFAAGNHEFSQYVGEAKEDAAYRNMSLDSVQSCFKNDIRFSSRIIGGVNFVALDNSYYLVEPEQLSQLSAEIEKGLPTVLFLHTPLYNEEIYDFSVKGKEHGAPAYLMSVPREKMRFYPEERFEQQLQDETTAQAFRRITTSPNIKAIFAGHIHKDFETFLAPDLPQLVTGIGSLRIVTLK